MLKAAKADFLAHLDRTELLMIKQLLHRMAHAEPTMNGLMGSIILGPAGRDGIHKKERKDPSFSLRFKPFVLSRSRVEVDVAIRPISAGTTSSSVPEGVANGMADTSRGKFLARRNEA
jgi:hypothetical protein